MNVELYINEELIETDPTISFPLTKQFADLSSPSDIITEYSKQIKVPFSENNDRVLCNMKSLDSTSEWLDNFDPTRRLSFRLVYNNSNIMEGYCRVMSIVRRGDSGYYNIVLYGELSRVFRELRRLTFDPKDTNGVLIPRLFADVTCNASNIYTGIKGQMSMTSNGWSSIIGFVPNTTRNKDFNNKSVEVSGVIKELTEILDSNQSFIGTNVTSDSVVGDGLTARDMNELRSYAQLPFVYWPRFWKMVQDAGEKLTGYSWELDKDWFNDKNIPYYNLVMMLKSLPTDMRATHKNEYRVGLNIVYHNDLNIRNKFTLQLLKNGSNETIPIVDYTTSKFDMTKAKMARIDGTITLTISMPHRGANGAYLPIKFGPEMAFECTLFATNDKIDNPFQTGENWYGFSHFWGGSESGLSSWKIGDYWSDSFGGSASKVTSLSIAPTSVNARGKTAFKLTLPVNVLMTASNANNDPKFWLRGILKFYQPQFVDLNGNPVSVQDIDIKVSTTTDLLSVQVSNDIVRSHMPFNFYDLWDTSVKPFDIILNYCKMFRILIFKDDVEKKLKFVRQNNYFKNHDVVDWTDKVNLKKDFVIEPISFDYKKLLMNYHDNEIGLNNTYEDKFGVKYGEIALNTYQEFSDKQKELFSQPLRNAIPYSPSYFNWDRLLRGDIARTISSDVFVACADSDGVMRDNFGALMFDRGLRNVDESSEFVSYLKLSDDTYLQANTGTYCWGGKGVDSNDTNVVTKYHYLSDVYGSFCLDYTVPKQVYVVNKKEYENASGIYEKYWKRWLDEIHSRDCKKVTCYVNLTLRDWLNFQFNHFVQIDKQLYFVNKITDFDASGKNTSTQVELLRVSNLSNWTEQ